VAGIGAWNTLSTNQSNIHFFTLSASGLLPAILHRLAKVDRGISLSGTNRLIALSFSRLAPFFSARSFLTLLDNAAEYCLIDTMILQLLRSQ